MAWTTLTNGTLPDASPVMGNFNLLPRKLGESTTPATTTSASFTNIGSVAIGAGVCSGEILCIVELTGDSDFGASNRGYPSFQIKVDTTVQRASFDGVRAINGTVTTRGPNTVYFYYVPSAGEMSAGFTVNIEGKLTTTLGTSAGLAGFTRMVIYGAKTGA